jgi:hypothetical protein
MVPEHGPFFGHACASAIKSCLHFVAIEREETALHDHPLHPRFEPTRAPSRGLSQLGGAV